MHILLLDDSHRALVRRIGAEQGKSGQYSADTQVPSMLIFGTMGYEAYLLLDGRVWIVETIDWSLPSERAVSHFAEYTEALGAIHMAARSRYPQLASLLVDRHSNAFDCATCQGTGIIVGSEDSERPIFCGECHSLGWILPGTS